MERARFSEEQIVAILKEEGHQVLQRATQSVVPPDCDALNNRVSSAESGREAKCEAK